MVTLDSKISSENLFGATNILRLLLYLKEVLANRESPGKLAD
jgi:hypothetical protein